MADANSSRKIEQLSQQQTEQEEQAWLDAVRKCRSAGLANLNSDVGLAFSGGGVRSATFNLGVLQALASHTVLAKVGYISSVSGGSYINSWLAAWISRNRFASVNRALADQSGNTHENPGDRYNSQRPIAHLRHYSSYLTPHKGILSSDVWTAVAAYVLRLAPNLLFVLLVASEVIVAPYILRNAYLPIYAGMGLTPRWPLIICGIGMLLFGIRDLASWLEKQSRFKRWFENGSWLNYKPDQSTESRKAAARHAWITFSAMLLLGPTLAVVGFNAFTEAYFSPPWTFASLFLLALLSTILFSRSIGLRRNNGGKSNSMRLYLTLAVSTLVGTVVFVMAAVTLSLCYEVPNLDSNLRTGVGNRHGFWSRAAAAGLYRHGFCRGDDVALRVRFPGMAKSNLGEYGHLNA